MADRDGRLQYMAASSESVKLLELFQIQQQAGPCWDAFHSRTPVVNADLAQDTDRWPQFAARSVTAGFRSVHAFPLRLRQETIGALNVFTRTLPADLQMPWSFVYAPSDGRSVAARSVKLQSHSGAHPAPLGAVAACSGHAESHLPAQDV